MQRQLMIVLSLMLIFMLLPACDQTSQETAETKTDTMVSFKGRNIDLKPYVEGWPYYGFKPSYDAGKLFYYHQDSTTSLKMLDLNGEMAFEKGEIISDIDFSKRNVWGIKYRKADGKLYWSGDERNDEVINLYRLDPSNGHVEKLTDVPYIFGWAWDPTETKIAYVARLGSKEKRLSELRILDIESGEEEVIMKDTPEYRLLWGTPSWQPDGKGVVLHAARNAHRTQGNLIYADLRSKTWKLLTDPEQKRYFPSADETWLDDDDMIVYSNEDGFVNLYRYNVKSKRSSQLTSFTRDISDSEILEIDGRKMMFIVLSNPIENDVLLMDLTSGQMVHQEKMDVNVSILDTRDNKLLISTNSASKKFRIDEMELRKEKFISNVKVDMPTELKDKILHTRVERVEYPTFDVDPNTGKPRMLHGFLYHPENPLPKEEQLVAIHSFYGGGNRFSNRTQILAEAGIYVFSPAPRGSFGFGKEFMALNDGDLGGNEIIDIIYAAKYVSEKLDIPASRVGVTGGSHGGYATMRLLTFPGEINGNEAAFDWGFGISHAGFSDIAHFYENCNIPDWVTLEAGDPATEADKLRDRSPLYHADKMVGKLLLTHGTNDSRVPIEGSRWMADSLRAYDKDVTLVEFDGQGHGIKGLANTIRNYNVWFDFLEKVN